MNLVTLRTTRLPWVELARSLTPPAVWRSLYRTLVVKDIPDASQYRPHYSPWLAPWFQKLYHGISPFTVVSIERCWTLWQGLGQAMARPGDVLEAGVFQGGTARLLRTRLGEPAGKQLYLFDSFEGMKSVSDQQDRHAEGDFSDTSVEGVRRVVGSAPWIHFCKGWVPQSFIGYEDRSYCFAHIDLDLYQGVFDCLQYVYPRLSSGGVIVLDDYGFASCPGARQAVDEFFNDKLEKPLVLLTGQALVHKL